MDRNGEAPGRPGSGASPGGGPGLPPPLLPPLPPWAAPPLPPGAYASGYGFAAPPFGYHPYGYWGPAMMPLPPGMPPFGGMAMGIPAGALPPGAAGKAQGQLS